MKNGRSRLPVASSSSSSKRIWFYSQVNSKVFRGWHNLKYKKKMQRHLMDYSSKKSITWLNIHPVGRLIFIFFKVVHTFFFLYKRRRSCEAFFWDANVASTEHWELLFSYSFKVVGAWNPGDFHHQVSSLFASLTNYSSSSSCWLLSFSIKVHRQCTKRKAQEQTDEENI